ncbi:DNA ligase [Bradyrhizobium stylosanthis]|uniref:ATP-dependent DNA ligase n=1 Tax=Bradyrhizobium stylosanthis TaxID=1803665 RepID=UPI0009EF3467|nr:DNA ligase [Bradyrhizobium stylosanthis]
MSTAFEFCLPTAAKAVPTGCDWFHEVKYDGYRLRVERNGSAVRLITRNGHDWTKRFPWIVEAALKNREKQFDFDALHSRKYDHEVQLYAFDVLALGGEDFRQLPLEMRKTNLARLLRGRPEGIFVAPFESGEIGPDLFRKACEMGLEGLVSKRRDRRYIAGRTREWLKIKNHTHPAMSREFSRAKHLLERTASLVAKGARRRAALSRCVAVPTPLLTTSPEGARGRFFPRRSSNRGRRTYRNPVCL